MIFNHTENRTVDACAPTVFSFVGSEKPGRFPFVKPFCFASIKQRSLRLTLWGNSFPGFCQPENEVIRGYRGGIPEAPMITNVYQKAVLVTLQHRYYFSTRALRSLKESAVLSPLHHCLLYPRTVFRIDAPKQTAGPQRLCSLQDI